MPRILGHLALVVALAALVPAGPASAQATFQLLGDFYVTGLSNDASSACGSASYQTVRWTEATGAVFLGLDSVPLIGKGGGAPDISGNGTLVVSTIANEDSTIATWGLWTKGVGWERLMPPYPPGGGAPDSDGGSPYAVSRDGSTVVGLIWIGSRGHAGAWTRESGMVDLGARGAGGSSRANATNLDGTVIAGWSSSPLDGTYPGMWQPTVWENGELIVLDETPVRCEAQGLSSDGTIAVGMLYNATYNFREPAIWFNSGGTWMPGQSLGHLPGSAPFDTQCITSGVTDDGSIVVGEYLFDLWNRTGFVWTPEQGLMTADEYFADRGVPVPAGFTVTGLSVVSRYGRHIAGWGYDEANPAAAQSFIVTFPPVSAVPDVAAAAVGLEPAYPNPFNPETSLALVVDRDQDVRLAVYDTRGALVRELHAGRLAAGRHVFRWDGCLAGGAPAPSGVYLARAEDRDGRAQVQRLALVK